MALSNMHDDLRNAACSAWCAQLNSGYVVFDDGGVEAATVTFNVDAFQDAASGIATANDFTADTSATGGTVDGATIQSSTPSDFADASVGLSGEDFNFNNLTVGPGDTVDITTMTVTFPAS